MLKDYRKKLDRIDTEIVKLLKKREDVIKKVGRYKKKIGLKICDPKREKELIKDKLKMAGRLNKKFVESIFRLILKESKRKQKEAE